MEELERIRKAEEVGAESLAAGALHTTQSHSIVLWCDACPWCCCWWLPGADS